MTEITESIRRALLIKIKRIFNNTEMRYSYPVHLRPLAEEIIEGLEFPPNSVIFTSSSRRKGFFNIEGHTYTIYTCPNCRGELLESPYLDGCYWCGYLSRWE